MNEGDDTMELIEMMCKRCSIRKYAEEPFRIVGILALGVPAEEKDPYGLDDLKREKVHR